MSNLEVLAIIPARGGSKSIPRKNLRLLGNKPLIAWPIELAQSTREITRIIVSSDDDEILTVAKTHGAEVLGKRPPELSRDEVPTFPVLLHTLTVLNETQNYIPDIVILLYPTTPFLNTTRITQAIQIIQKEKANSVIGVRKVKGVVWKKDKTGSTSQFYPEERANRQYSDHLYEEAGNIYISRSQVLLNQNRLIDKESCRFIEIEKDEIMDIDEPEDFVEAEKRLEKN